MIKTKKDSNNVWNIHIGKHCVSNITKEPDGTFVVINNLPGCSTFEGRFKTYTSAENSIFKTIDKWIDDAMLCR